MAQSTVDVAKEVARRSQKPTVKVMLSQFIDECPECKSEKTSWEILYIDEGKTRCENYDFVKYQCKICKAIFKKIEPNK